MFQTDQASAVLTLPAPVAAGTPGYFTNGNPVTGIAPTILDADFMNMMMMELVNLVQAAGLTLSKTNYSQVLAAVRSLGVSSASLVATGYVNLANGLIFEWGTSSTLTTADVPVVFPKAFPIAPFQVYVSIPLTTVAAMAGYNSLTVNGFNVNAWFATGGRAASTVSWFSIGH